MSTEYDVAMTLFDDLYCIVTRNYIKVTILDYLSSEAIKRIYKQETWKDIDG